MKRGGSLSFLVGTISNVLVMEIGWTDVLTVILVYFKKRNYFLQIASGLGYLHKQGIIYRALKSDNILVFSLDLNSSVNVKLSDYGISRFCSSGGTAGLVGTPGYQAPEIIDGQSYDDKVRLYEAL